MPANRLESRDRAVLPLLPAFQPQLPHWIPAFAGMTPSGMHGLNITAAVLADQPFDFGAALAEFLFDALKAAINMIDPVDDGFAPGGEAGDD